MDTDGDPNLPPPQFHLSSNSNSSSSSSLNPSQPDFLRNVQAAFKRHRSLGTMQPPKLLPRRSVPPQRSHINIQADAHELALLSPPSFSNTTDDHNHNVDSNHCHLPEASKKVKFSLATSTLSQGGVDGQKPTRPDLATTLDNLSSHMDSLAFTEIDWEAINQPDLSNGQLKQSNPLTTDADGGSSVLAGRMSSLHNQLHHLRDFLHTDVSHPITQSSVAGSSCATTTSVHATSAPMLNSTTHSSCPHQHTSALNANQKSDGVHQPSLLSTRLDTDRVVTGAQHSSSAPNASAEQAKEIQQCQLLTDPSQTQGESIKQKGLGADASNVLPPCPSSKDLSSNAKPEPPKSDKQPKTPSRKKGYDPDLFFKVNGKLYQRLGKIGSGGSSEVHKVISSDCTIYALKKIKLKGRDYATAYGFCQEILYLKKLKGKDNIIQLIDYEVTDKALLHEVMNDSISNKDNRVKDDGYIYMVLEYGEIDLAHMLSQKWKVIEASNSTMDQNWLRFYWQQILQAVNTIHEERIVHSDLKPANFLLVRGSLKLIDFGIAKAIMSDTTNIQRDAQVGTLSYMSPEAFMCNESDANGNTIKCGRPSDIWSLGCILYQMVYGRTPFSEYKTFWAKFKVITDPNHEITYAPVGNPWLMDLMKKCLAWDRNERWRIPQLLEHPFLVPPIPHQQEKNCKFIQLITESCTNDEKVSSLCSKFQMILGDPAAACRDHQYRLLSQISTICQQLQEHITKTS